MPKCVYLDADILVFSNLKEIDDAIDGSPIAAAIDGQGSVEGMYPWHQGQINSPFVNTGIMGMNLEMWREQKIHLQILDFLSIESGRCKFADQNAINWILRDRIRLLDKRFNAMANEIDQGLMPILIGKTNIHYASGMKPWKRPIPTISHALWMYFNSLFPSQESKIDWSFESFARYIIRFFAYQKANPYTNQKKRIEYSQCKKNLNKILNNYFFTRKSK